MQLQFLKPDFVLVLEINLMLCKAIHVQALANEVLTFHIAVFSGFNFVGHKMFKILSKPFSKFTSIQLAQFIVPFDKRYFYWNGSTERIDGCSAKTYYYWYEKINGQMSCQPTKPITEARSITEGVMWSTVAELIESSNRSILAEAKIS